MKLAHAQSLWWSLIVVSEARWVGAVGSWSWPTTGFDALNKLIKWKKREKFLWRSAPRKKLGENARGLSQQNGPFFGFYAQVFVIVARPNDWCMLRGQKLFCIFMNSILRIRWAAPGPLCVHFWETHRCLFEMAVGFTDFLRWFGGETIANHLKCYYYYWSANNRHSIVMLRSGCGKKERCVSGKRPIINDAHCKEWFLQTQLTACSCKIYGQFWRACKFVTLLRSSKIIGWWIRAAIKKHLGWWGARISMQNMWKRDRWWNAQQK